MTILLSSFGKKKKKKIFSKKKKKSNRKMRLCVWKGLDSAWEDIINRSFLLQAKFE